MKKFFYQILVILSRSLGTWAFVVLARIVATGYFCFFPKRVARSVRFYRKLFPDSHSFYPIGCAWSQYQQFTSVFLDRFLLQESGNLSYTDEGWEYLEQAVKNRTGGVILMSHIGNWEVAAHLFKRKLPAINLLLYMGIKEKEQIEQIQKQSISSSGIQIIAVDQGGGTVLDIMEGIRMLKQGGFVSLAGDIIWKSDQRTIPVDFLNDRAYLPEMPHVLALLSGAPLFIFFAVQTENRQYHFSTTPPIWVRAPSRLQRREAIRESAQYYATMIENSVRRYPSQWYHFDSGFSGFL